MKAVLLAVSLILSLPGYSIAAPGTPMELSLPTKHVLMIKVNELRAARNALSMDCIRFWNNSMAAYAQEVANNCSTLAPKDPKYPVAISAAVSESSTKAFDSILDIAFFYNSQSNLCNVYGDETFATEQCQNFRQFYRFEAYEMGCAVSKCEQITPQAPPTGQLVRGPFLWVCAFTSRAPPEMPPYLQLPAGTQNCLMCSYQKSKCDEVTKNLCCDDAWDKLIVPPQDSQGNPTGPSGSSGTSSDAHVNVRLYRHVTSNRTVMVFEGLNNTIPAEISNDPSRYTDAGPFVSVIKNGSSAAGCKELKPIHQLYSNFTRETTYVANETQIDKMRQQGFQDMGIIGQTVSGLQDCNANKVVITSYGVNGYEIRVANTTDENVIWRQLFPKYALVRINFIAWDAVQSAKK